MLEGWVNFVEAQSRNIASVNEGESWGEEEGGCVRAGGGGLKRLTFMSSLFFIAWSISSFVIRSCVGGRGEGARSEAKSIEV